MVSCLTKIAVASLLLLDAMCPIARADLGLTANATILDPSCKITLDGGGNINLGVVSTAYVNSTPSAAQYFSGGKTFTLSISECGSGTDGAAGRMHLSFSPQSGNFADARHQTFINETPMTSGGATGTGIVIFAKERNKNVLDPGGGSDVIYPFSASDYDTKYLFEARFQKTATAVAAGKVHSSVIVSAYYD
ncbi:fimbrial protein [Obesumbacterium proteus]|uniref:fimbrial-like protein n=1 Tax=Obesumbacterium proteus TaxID=82983 RepID=UPI0010351164|nr:fimbrial-like protein [Obesumbacterium proteus]TBL78899.1 fimbrial protein [Obesumbacterium proteus]